MPFLKAHGHYLNNDHAPFCLIEKFINSSWHWDPGYYFSNKYLKILPSEKKSKRSPVGG
jgi:hypothetical protein